ncbi:MAG: ABC transporter substrate-binding protein [Desulfobacteraceae bacterium]|nr:MAG: ABC transporter substrate-binding protein [Desulfobacteraceae bacterium]
MKKFKLVMSVLLTVGLVMSSGFATAADPIKLGMTGALSGPGSDLGLDALYGMEMAVKDINDAGGINGRPLKIISRDDQYDPSKAVTFAKELVFKENVVAFFPSTATTPNVASEQVTLPAKVPHLIAGTTSDIVCPVGKCNPYAFRLSILNSWQGMALADFAANSIKAKKIALLYDNTEYGMDGRKMLLPALEKYGLKPVYEGTFSLGDVSMTAQVKGAKDAGADCVITWSLGAEVARIVLEKKKQKYDVPLLGSEAITMANFRSLAGGAADGTYIADRMRAAYSDPDPQIKKFMDRYLETYKKDPNMAVPSWTITYYDTVMWLAEALKKVGPDRAKIRDALESSGTFVGVTGIKYTFSASKHNGRSPEAVSIVMVKDGRLVDPIVK